MSSYPPIIDGHNDTILNLYSSRLFDVPYSFYERNDHSHIDLPRAKEGGLGGGFFAIYNPNQFSDRTKATGNRIITNAVADDEPLTYQRPMPPQVPLEQAQRDTNGMFTMLLQLEKQGAGQVKIVRTASDLAHCIANDIFAIIIHFEGAEAIDTNLDALHVYYAAGLRSLGIVWSRPTDFAYGVPFHFPAGPDIGDGLTDAGKRLVNECNQLGIMIDMSHLNEKGFWDVADLSDAPLVCTHSNAHAMCQSPRNLTDRQLDAIKETNGVTGLNYHKGFLRADGKAYNETSLREIVRHAGYIADRIGVDHLVLGSDFDGAAMPEDLVDAAGLPKLMDALSAHGFSSQDLEKIAHSNWQRILSATWK